MQTDRIVLRPESRLFLVLSKIFDLFLLSVLWLICSVPLVTIGAATTALYYTAVKSVRRGRGGIIENFVRCFRVNFRQSALLTLLYIAFTGWTYILYRLAAGLSGGTGWSAVYPFVIAGFLIPVGAMLAYQFPVLSRFCLPLNRQLKMAFGMAIRHFPSTLLLVAVVTAAAWTGYRCPLLLCLLPGAACLLCSLPMERIFAKYMVRPTNGEYGETDWCWGPVR